MSHEYQAMFQNAMDLFRMEGMSTNQARKRAKALLVALERAEASEARKIAARKPVDEYVDENGLTVQVIRPTKEPKKYITCPQNAGVTSGYFDVVQCPVKTPKAKPQSVRWSNEEQKLIPIKDYHDSAYYSLAVGRTSRTNYGIARAED